MSNTYHKNTLSKIKKQNDKQDQTNIREYLFELHTLSLEPYRPGRVLLEEIWNSKNYTFYLFLILNKTEISYVPDFNTLSQFNEETNPVGRINLHLLSGPKLNTLPSNMARLCSSDYRSIIYYLEYRFVCDFNYMGRKLSFLDEYQESDMLEKYEKRIQNRA